MAVKIRLQRHGRKGKPFYHIVVADSRSPRDGKFIEKIGIYDPLTEPATIDLNVDRAVTWLQNGAQPTDTAKGLLSTKGALYKNHLMGGVAKGIHGTDQVEERYKTWVSEKQAKLSSLIASKSSLKADGVQKRRAEETKIKEERAKALEAKRAKMKEAAEAAVEPAQENGPIDGQVQA